MPSVTQEVPTVQSCKKRKLDDNSHHHPPLYAGLLAEFAVPRANSCILSSPNASNTPRGVFTDKNLDHAGLLHHHHHHHHHPSPLATRKILPLPSVKRRRTSVDIDAGAEDEPMRRSPSTSPTQRQQRQQHSHTKNAHRDEELLRDKIRPSAPGSSSSNNNNNNTIRHDLMARCHICFRKPTKKSDLDSFADCQGCGQRTCYVCIRECLGWGPPSLQAEHDGMLFHDQHRIETAAGSAGGTPSFTMLDADDAPGGEEDHQQQRSPQPSETITSPPPPPLPPTATAATGGMTVGREGQHETGWARGGGHRQMVCSRCCVERGQDGDVVCLGCLPFVEG